MKLHFHLTNPAVVPYHTKQTSNVLDKLVKPPSMLLQFPRLLPPCYQVT